ncbi:OprD family outer membrane porin [Campylobacter concisus]|jgi:major outer membrane protein|uniref:Major outer membrane protein n=1 Tax=Campylobacter concisus TaxID=199 RepID=A0A2R4NZA0_9BACT|nr:OprD family outer membrane porin [Campylobacter concisus]AVX43758.1 Major outer membrane protein [Campylobacter concisus]MCA6130177.1 major outer membrane protein [Campylobacter concisus]MCA6132197.1 major outer membrane protein [Campylobacter concisus]
MKLTKISLAALVALGAFSSVASATPLEEAIKNVDLSGFARYRYTNTRNKSADASATPSQDRNKAGHNFKMITNFKAAIDDNFFGVVGLRYNATDGSGDNAGAGTDKTNTTKGFGVHQFYLGYKIGGTTITAGKQVIGSYFTDDAVGTGVRVENKDIEGLTLTALAFDALEGDDVESGGDLYKATGYLSTYDVGNLYAAGIAGSYDPINFQLWYGTLTNLADVLAADVSGNFAITNDISLGARINYAHSQADTSAKNALGYDDGNFYAGELSTSLFGLDLAAGYIGYKTQNYQDGKYSAFTFEDQGGLIDAGEDVFDWTRAEGKGSYFYATSAYTFDKFTAGLDYIKGSYKTDEKTKVEEFVPRFAYQYNKKLKFSSFYAFKTEKEHDGDKNKADKFRFEAKYSF